MSEPWISSVLLGLLAVSWGPWDMATRRMTSGSMKVMGVGKQPWSPEVLYVGWTNFRFRFHIGAPSRSGCLRAGGAGAKYDVCSCSTVL